MNPLYPSTKITLHESTISKAGRGVFATVDIQKGETIEVCPVLRISKEDYLNVKKTILREYYFMFSGDENSAEVVITLGYGSLYNHSYEPNATYIKKPAEDVIEFAAIKDIKKGEEISVNYNFGNPDDKSKLWIEKIPEYKEK